FNELFRFASEIRPALYGILLILATLFLPDGLESIPDKIRAWWTTRNDRTHRNSGSSAQTSSQAPARKTTSTTTSST
ncbi:MAG TPA: hypothetical protein VKA48_11515, partial [Gammaproteobacteria bacterium]|nr:hypothetical protein [Gammaproteobacteria bacterium]